METLETIKTRRSIRNFSDKNISESDILTLKEALLHSPTSRTRHTWNFYFVHNKDLIEKLSLCKKEGSQLVAGSKLAVVVCGDENICDVWIEDASISAIILQLAAHDMGLASCWVQVRERKHSDKIYSETYIQNLMNIPKNQRVLCIIAIGYPNELKAPYEYGELRFDKITDIQ